MEKDLESVLEGEKQILGSVCFISSLHDKVVKSLSFTLVTLMAICWHQATVDTLRYFLM